MRWRAVAGPIACLLLFAGCPASEPEAGQAGAPAEGAGAPPGGTPDAAQAPAPGSEGAVCGGIRGLACAEPLWCDPDPGFCKGADIQGTCVAVPEMCTRDYRPVCGCDGKTHGNECTRRSARVAKDYDGECRPAEG